MSKLFLTSIDLNKNELLNVRLQNLASAPGSPAVGQTYYDTTDQTAKFYNGSAWIPFDASKVANGSISLAKLVSDPLARANHTGTQVASTISDFSTAVNAIVDPKIESAAAGIDSKQSVRVVANANISLSGTQTIDGVVLSVGERVLVRGQSTATQNGVYVVSAGAWGRAADADQNYELTPGAFWFVEEGVTYGKSQWRIENTGAITIGSTSITINQFGAAVSYTEGNGITFTGNVISAEIKASNSGLVLDASGLYIDTSVVSRKFSANIGDNSATSFVVTHNLGNQDVVASIRTVAAPYAEVIADIQYTSANTITVSFASSPTTNQFRVVVIG